MKIRLSALTSAFTSAFTSFFAFTLLRKGEGVQI